MKWSLRLFIILIIFLSIGFLLKEWFSYEKIELGGNIAGVRYNDDVGFYPKVLLEGTHRILKDDTVIIYHLNPIVIDDYIEAKFYDGSVGKVYFKMKMKIRADSLPKLHYNYGELFTKRFLEPTTYYTIRKFTDQIPKEDSLLGQSLPEKIRQSEIASYFWIDTLAFSLYEIDKPKSITGYWTIDKMPFSFVQIPSYCDKIKLGDILYFDPNQMKVFSKDSIAPCGEYGISIRNDNISIYEHDMVMSASFELDSNRLSISSKNLFNWQKSISDLSIYDSLLVNGITLHLKRQDNSVR
ncbi:hypothetical protein [Ekhidna sp.]|uniref:hypothetical protein n=1 Tax=Ekhidna sp. TaxID=2608089 RepID=UPI003B5CBC3B